jgi:hypothetical protein
MKKESCVTVDRASGSSTPAHSGSWRHRRATSEACRLVSGCLTRMVRRVDGPKNTFANPARAQRQTEASYHCLLLLILSVPLVVLRL